MTQTSYASRKKGIFFMVLGMLVYSILNAIVKETTGQYGSVQLAFFRCTFATFPALFLLITRGRWTPPSRPEWKFHFMRAGLIAVGLSFLFLGIGMLPLADSMSIYFSTTLFLVLLSYPILKEKITLIQGLSVFIGFLGVLVIARPSGTLFHWGVVFVLLGALFEAGFNLYGRLLSPTTDTFLLTFLGTLLPALALGFIIPFVWVTPDFEGWIALISLGLGGGLGQLCVTTAYRYAPAGTLAPMIYSSILWSILFDIILFGNWPTRSLLLGCTIIISSGLLIFFSETRKKRKNR